jgi:hypothetical protein
MIDNTPNNSSKSDLAKLRLQRDAKFEEIVACLAGELCASLASKTDRDHLIDEAEELTDKWAAAANKPPPQLSTRLQILLSEHQEICLRIIELIDAGPSNTA